MFHVTAAIPLLVGDGPGGIAAPAFGIASTLLAVLLMWPPGAGALVSLWLIAACAVLFGLILHTLGFKLRKHRTKTV